MRVPRANSNGQTKIVEALPDNLIGSLPSVEDVEAELALNGEPDMKDES